MHPQDLGQMPADKMPIRLAIAAKILAGAELMEVRLALRRADALLEAFCASESPTDFVPRMGTVRQEEVPPVGSLTEACNIPIGPVRHNCYICGAPNPSGCLHDDLEEG